MDVNVAVVSTEVAQPALIGSVEGLVVGQLFLIGPASG